MNAWVVFRKELLDTLRDRRTLWAMILGPVLVMPLLVILPQKLMQRQIDTQETSMIRLAVEGAEDAPGLIEFLRRSGEVEIMVSEDPGQAVREELAAVGLVLPEGFEAMLQQERTAQVELLADQSELTGGVQVERVRTLLMSYGQSTVALRLESRGVDPEILVPFRIEDVNVATEQQMSGAYLGMMLPMFIVLWSLVGGMYTAIDVTAGEKERMTLEPLLATSAGRTQIVLGKLMAVVSTSLVALLLSISSLLLAFAWAAPAGGSDGTGSAFYLDPLSALLVLAAALPVVLMFSGLEMAVCLLARSFKEAQNYIVPLQFVVLIPAVAVMVMPDLSLSLPTFAVPIFSTLVVLRDALRGQVGAAGFVVSAGSSMLYAAAAVALAVWQFGREKVLFRV
ncbi:MAG: ABC transporter permease [Chloroflexota bacterium]